MDSNSPLNTLEHLIVPESYTQKLSLEECFHNRNNMEIDVGCGKGRFLLEHAKRFPETNFIGIERMTSRVQKICKKLTRNNITNVRILQLEASYTIQYLIPPNSVSKYYIFFPDPWPKRRHSKRRLFSPSFLDSISKTLANNGSINFATDNPPYFEAVYKTLSNDIRFQETQALVLDEDERTDFEIIFLGKESEIGRCSFIKKETSE